MSKRKHIIWILILGVFLFLFLYKYGGTRVTPRLGDAVGYLTTVGEFRAEEVLELKTGDMYKQTVTGTRDEIVGFSIRFGTYGQQVEGKLKATFSDVSGETIYGEEIFDTKDLIDNQYRLFLLDQVITDGLQKEYEISLEVLSLEEGKQLSLFASDENIYEKGDLTYQDKEVKNTDIACQLAGTSGFMQKWYWIVCAVIIVGFLAFAFVAFVKKCKLEYIYLTLGLTFGMVFVLSLPPYTAPDEGTHISTTYAFVSEFLGEDPIFDEANHVISRGTDGDIGGEAQVSLVKFHDLYEAVKYPSGDLERDFARGGKLDVPFTCYLPQILGVLLGVLLKFSGFWTLYLGKVFAMLFFTICIFFSIKLIPWGKMVIMTVALLPMSMELASSFSYDCVLNALCILFISYTLHLICKKDKVTWKDFLFLGIIICVIAPCKMFYFLIAGMLYLIPKEKYKSKKTYWMMNTGILVAGLTVLIIMRFQFLTSHVGGATPSAIEDATVNYSIATILGDIPHSISVLFNTAIIKSEFYYNSMWGNQLGSLQVYIPTFVITSFVLVLFTAGVCTTREERVIYEPDAKFRLVNLGLSLLMFLGILAALWIGWTPVTYGVIEGVQGRYFLPFLPMIFLSMRNKTFLLQKNIDRGLSAVLFAGLTFTFLYMIPYIVQ
ncbi:MAG: DUF2142 domain-containing protein [Blautia sp.]|uniref:DUF2142 domain-containing protein n=1 Tax=Blautia sp. TaxID=1955243 RepID=UPI002E75D53C|nr:DUF2142 domain-containing protein [Blautia sp.]MEE1443333.1 DUF2142 domain-containing protein [Blautia sp.]